MIESHRIELLKQTFKEGLFTDLRKAEGALKDIFPDMPKLANTLGLALKIGVLKELESNDGNLPMEVAIPQLSLKLSESYGTKEEDAVQAVGVWAIVCGKVSEEQVNTISGRFVSNISGSRTGLSEIRTSVLSESDTKECPFCAEIIKKKAKLCKHCKSKLEDDSVSKASTIFSDGYENNEEKFKVACIKVWEDGIVTPEEAEYLLKLSKQLNISEQRSKEIFEGVKNNSTESLVVQEEEILKDGEYESKDMIAILDRFSDNWMPNYCNLEIEQFLTEHLEKIKIFANNGHKEAMYWLGEYYVAIIENEKEAAKWFKLAADQKYAPGQSRLGFCYYEGFGLDQDYTEALKWYQLSAEQGNSDAQKALGDCYYYGKGVPQYYEEAVKWYKLAAVGSNSEAQNILGHCYYNGRGVDIYLREAAKWYKLSAEQGNSEAQYNIAFCYYNGKGVPKDYKEAVNWFKLSAEQGNSEAQKSLGDCYYNGRGVQCNYKEAVKWYLLSAERGYCNAQISSGNCYYRGEGVPQNYSEAAKWFRLAAEQGNSNAQNLLGDCYYKETEASQDYKEAVKWYKFSAEQENAKAQYNLGFCYYKGTGVNQNYKEALKWFRMSADQGNFDAPFLIETILGESEK